MKTRYSFLLIFLLALMATGCKKEYNGRVRIFAENMRNDSKILIDPEYIDEATWVAEETILIGGRTYEICGNEDDGFYIEDVPENASGIAIYPGGGDNYNDIEVIGNEVNIRRLAVSFLGESNNVQEVVFPMVAALNGDQLHFKHLTAGLKVTLVAPDHPIDLASVKIVAQAQNLEQSDIIEVNGMTARWAVQGPSVPHGDVGSATGNYPAAFACEMNIDVLTISERYNEYNESVPFRYPGITLYGDEYGNHDSRSFCVPITIKKLRYITVTGYSYSGTQLFHVTKDLGSDQVINRNTMYTVPPIEIN